MTPVMTTADLPESKRFARWRETICDAFVLVDCEQTSDRPFFGELVTTRVKDSGFSRVRSRGQKISRTPYHIRQSRGEVLLVSLQLAGTCMFSQDGREANLGPGDLTCYDGTRPFHAIQSGDFEQLMLHLPTSRFVKKVGLTEQFTLRPVRAETDMGALVSNFLRQASTFVTNADQKTAHRLVEMSVDLVTTAVGDLFPQQASQTSGRMALLYRAKALIEDNLHDPDLNAEKVAKRLGVSLRYIQEIFQEEKITLSNWIWERRLQKCRRDLADPHFASKTVSQIAFNCGFSSFSHFCHRFKAAFSMSATEFRHEHREPKN